MIRVKKIQLKAPKAVEENSIGIKQNKVYIIEIIYNLNNCLINKFVNEGIILSAFYYGYILLQVIGGRLAEMVNIFF
jgi:hypothetical protein